MPAIEACIIDPLWDQFSALLPDHQIAHPLGSHRPRVPGRVIVDTLVQVLVFGCAYWRIVDDTVSETTLRRRRDEWIDAGIMERLPTLVLAQYNRIIGLEVGDIAVDGCLTTAPCGGEAAGNSPVDQGKQGLKRSTVVDANGIPLGTVAAPANRHDSPLLEPTLDTLARLGPLPEPMIVHLDRGYGSGLTRDRLAKRGVHGKIAATGAPVPLTASQRWPVERTNACMHGHKKLVWCTERRAVVVDVWLAFSAVIIIVRRLVRADWTRFRWDDRPARQP